MDYKFFFVKNLFRGSFLFRKKGEFIVVTWKDKKFVYFILIIFVGNVMDIAKRKVKENGVWVEKEF